MSNTVLTQNIAFFLLLILNDLVLQNTPATLCYNCPEETHLGSRCHLVVYLFSGAFVNTLNNLSPVVDLCGTLWAALLHCQILIPDFPSCQLLLTHSKVPSPETVQFLKDCWEGHCQENHYSKVSKSTCPGRQLWVQPTSSRGREEKGMRNVGICQLMAVFEGAIPETTEDWQRNEGCTKVWGTRSQVNTLKMGTVKCTHQISEVVGRSVITPNAPEECDTCQWATGHTTLKNEPNPNLIPKPCQSWAQKQTKKQKNQNKMKSVFR